MLHNKIINWFHIINEDNHLFMLMLNEVFECNTKMADIKTLNFHFVYQHDPH